MNGQKVLEAIRYILYFTSSIECDVDKYKIF